MRPAATRGEAPALRSRLLSHVRLLLPLTPRLLALFPPPAPLSFQVMYLPPLWLHHVVALTPGVSANVWQHDPELETAEGVFIDPVPFEEDWPQPVVAHALGPYIRGLVQGFDLEPGAWRDNILQQRFLPQQVRGRPGWERLCCRDWPHSRRPVARRSTGRGTPRRCRTAAACAAMRRRLLT